MKASEYLSTHRRADVALLHQLWAQGLSAGEIGRRMGVCQSTVSKWAQRYKLPKRVLSCQQDAAAPSPEDDAASLLGLALSPWVEERARIVRERHYAQRRNENGVDDFATTSPRMPTV